MNTKKTVGQALRLLASGGSADQDANVVAELLEQARDLATVVLADAGASSDARSAAEELLSRLDSDLY